MVVSGGYDMDPDWLAGGTGYLGTLVEIVGNHAVIELDAEIEVRRDGGWDDFGEGRTSPSGRRTEARGRWLVLSGAYEGHTWRDPIRRVHVSLCSQRPDVAVVSAGGGIGVWVESHATMRRAPSFALALKQAA